MILLRLTVRQVVILAVTGLLAAGIYLAAEGRLPILLTAAVLLPIGRPGSRWPSDGGTG